MDDSVGQANLAKRFAVAATVSALVFLALLAGSAGGALTVLVLVLTPALTVLSVVAGMIQIWLRKAVIEDVGKWWALAVTSLAIVALVIGLVS